MAAINPYAVNNSPMTTPIPPAQQILQNQQVNNGTLLAWVQGINGAKAYPLAQNIRAYLFDTEEDKFYLKVTDQTGIPQKLREFEYYEVESVDPSMPDMSKYATKEDLDDLSSKLDDILRQLQNVRKENHHGKSSVRGANEPRSNVTIQ